MIDFSSPVYIVKVTVIDLLSIFNFVFNLADCLNYFF